MHALRAFFLILMLPGCGALESCRDQGRRPIVYVDVVDQVSKGEGVVLPKAALESGALTAMRAWPDFAFRAAQAEETGWQLDLRVQMATQRIADPESGAITAEKLHRGVGVQLRLHPLDKADDARPEVSAYVLSTRDEAASVPYADLAEAAVVAAGVRLQEVMDLSWGPESAVVEALADKVQWRRSIGVQVAGQRRIKAAVPAIMTLVRAENEDPELVIKGVGALVAIRDPAGAAAIIDACRRKSSPYLVQMVFALGALGGRDAQGYLFTVQSGHPDPAVRAAAVSALQELEGRTSP